MQEPITREEMYLASAAGYDVDLPEPVTRKEFFLAKLAGMDVETPAAFTRREMFIENAANNRSRSVIEPLEITENGTYTAPNGVDGYNPVVVNVPDPTKNVLLAEQEFGGFVLDSTFGAYSPGYVTPALFTLNNGETYHVKWDGTEYECKAFTFNYSGMSLVVIGNGTSLGLSGNGEPFLITYNAAYNNTQLFSVDTKSSHTVGIWQNVAQEIKLQNKTITENGEYTADSGFDGLGKVLVEVAGSSGDNFEPGLYIEALYPVSPLSRTHRYVPFNNELYLFVETSSNPFYSDIYKLVDGAFTLILSNVDISPSGTNPSFERNGEIHFLTLGDGHIVFDGNSIMKKNDPPGNVSSLCVLNETVYMLDAVNSKMYKWDEATDTYTAISTTGSNSQTNMIEHNGELIGYENEISKQKCSLFRVNAETGVFTLFRELAYKMYPKFTTSDGKLFITMANPSGGSYYCTYNVENDDLTILGSIPAISNIVMYRYNDEIRLASSNSGKFHAKVRIVK